MKWYTWLTALVVLVLSYLWLPTGGTDWEYAFAPAALRWWDAPWTRYVPYPPYATLLMYPGALLGSRIATALCNGASVLLLARIARRWGGAEWCALLVLASPVGAGLFFWGQVDVFVLAGLLLPEWLGVLVIVIKPQVAIFALAAKWRSLLGWPLVAGVVAGLVSLIIWSWWPLHILKQSAQYTDAVWNASLRFYLAPAGLWCIWRAYRTQDERYGVAASPLMFPYVNITSYIGVLTVLVCKWPKQAFVVWCFVMAGSITLLFL